MQGMKEEFNKDTEILKKKSNLNSGNEKLNKKLRQNIWA
jgi:hypothetical protein